MAIRLTDVIESGSRRGLGVTVLNRGFPDLAVLLGPIEFSIAQGRVTYEFRDFYLWFAFMSEGSTDNLRAYGATMYSGAVGHPHISGSSLSNFCFGDNVTEFSMLIENGLTDVLVTRMLQSVKLFTRGAYADIDAREHRNARCFCHGGERICKECSYRDVNGKLRHVSTGTMRHGRIVGKEYADEAVLCISCAAITINQDKICDSCREKKYCTLCKRTTRDTNTEVLGCHTRGCPVREERATRT